MSSFTRNTRRANSARRSRSLGVGLALTLASAAALAGAHRFVFTAYSDGAGGADVVAGRYRTALEELRSRPGDVDLDPSASNTNRCVAYSMTLQWREAHAACDAAVRAAGDPQMSRPLGWGWTASANSERLALAYANRAVMHWLSSDDSAARQDLAKAQQLSPRADFVARNLAALKMHVAAAKTHGEVAQTGAPAPKS